MPMKTSVQKIIGSLLWIAFLGTSTTAQAGSARKVSGWVTGLGPGARAQVMLRGARTHQTTTRPGGAWNIEQVPPGTYQAEVKSPGYTFAPPGRRVQVGPADVNAVNFRAQAQQAASKPPAVIDPTKVRRISGRVMGLKGPDRVVVTAQGPINKEIMTTPGGQYELVELPPGTYRIGIMDERYNFRPRAKNIKATRNNRRNVNFKAKRKPGVKQALAKAKPAPVLYRLSGKVEGLKALISGCQGATVFARRGKKVHRTKTRTQDSKKVCGTFTFKALPAGKYTVSLKIRGHAFTYWTYSPEKQTIDLDKDTSGVEFEANDHERRSRRRRR